METIARGLTNVIAFCAGFLLAFVLGLALFGGLMKLVEVIP